MGVVVFDVGYVCSVVVVVVVYVGVIGSGDVVCCWLVCWLCRYDVVMDMFVLWWVYL